jgi:hypothetical protein
VAGRFKVVQTATKSARAPRDSNSQLGYNRYDADRGRPFTPHLTKSGRSYGNALTAPLRLPVVDRHRLLGDHISPRSSAGVDVDVVSSDHAGCSVIRTRSATRTGRCASRTSEATTASSAGRAGRMRVCPGTLEQALTMYRRYYGFYFSNSHTFEPVLYGLVSATAQPPTPRQVTI